MGKYPPTELMEDDEGEIEEMTDQLSNTQLEFVGPTGPATVVGPTGPAVYVEGLLPWPSNNIFNNEGPTA